MLACMESPLISVFIFFDFVILISGDSCSPEELHKAETMLVMKFYLDFFRKLVSLVTVKCVVYVAYTIMKMQPHS